jgi:hypothetical protein
MGLHEIYDPHLKVSKYQWGEIEGVNKMKSMTPGEKQQKKKIREDYVSGNTFKLYENVRTIEGRDAKVVFRGSNYLTLRYIDGSVEKRWLDDVMEAKVPVTYRTFVSNNDKKIPLLLMNEDQRRELFEQRMQLEFDGIETKNFDMCADAFAQFRKMIETIRNGDLLGEPTGHAVTSSHSAPTHKTVQAGIEMKPDTMRRMQFKQYLNV